MTRQLPLLATLLLALPAALPAADGDLDTSFSTDGKYSAFWGVEAEATAVAGLGDGSLLVGGWVRLTTPGSPRLALIKLRPNGSLDTGFGTGGRFEREVVIDGASTAAVLDVHPLADGRIVLAAWASRVYQWTAIVTLRLLENGSPDLTYGPNGLRIVEEFPLSGAHPVYFRSAKTPDGDLIFAGRCSGCDTADTFAMRLDADGEIDRDFGDDGWALFDSESGAAPQSIVVSVDPQGRPVVAANVGALGGLHELSVVRLTSFGGLDPSFGGGDGVAYVDFAAYAWPSGIAIDPVSARLHIATTGTLGGTSGVIALDSSGELVTDFGFGGVTPLDLEEGTKVNAIALQSDGKIVVAGSIDHTGAASTGFFLARLLPTGQFDDTFDDNGVVRYEFDLEGDAPDSARAVALVGGKLVAAGYAEDASDDSRPAMAVLRTQSALIFTDGFERGSVAGWLGN